MKLKHPIKKENVLNDGLFEKSLPKKTGIKRAVSAKWVNENFISDPKEDTNMRKNFLKNPPKNNLFKQKTSCVNNKRSCVRS